MLREGHIGFGFLLGSLVAFALVSLNVMSLEEFPIFAGLVGVFSFVPDIDITFGIGHRGPTHNISFGLICAFIVSVIVYYSYFDLYLTVLTFVAGFFAILSHLIADLFTHNKFKIFYPFSDKRYGGLGIDADSKVANRTLLLIGVVAYVFLYLFLSGELTIT